MQSKLVRTKQPCQRTKEVLIDSYSDVEIEEIPAADPSNTEPLQTPSPKTPVEIKTIEFPHGSNFSRAQASWGSNVIHNPVLMVARQKLSVFEAAAMEVSNANSEVFYRLNKEAKRAYDQGIQSALINQYQQAVKAFKKAWKLQSENYHYLSSYAIALIELGQYERAINLFHLAFRNGANSPNFLNNYGHVLYVLQNYDLAEKIYRQLINRAFWCGIYYQQLADVLMQQANQVQVLSSIRNKKIQEARHNYKQAIRMYYQFQDLPALRQLTNDLKIRLPDVAIKAYQSIIRLSPSDTQAYVQLAILLYENSNREYAVALLQKSIQLDPSCDQAYFELAHVFWVEGNSKQALALLQQAINLNPGNHLYKIKFIHIRERSLDGKNKQYPLFHLPHPRESMTRPQQKFLQLMTPLQLASLAKNFLSQGKIKESEKYIRRAIQLNHSASADDFFLLAEILIAKGHYLLGKKQYGKADSVFAETRINLLLAIDLLAQANNCESLMKVELELTLQGELFLADTIKNYVLIINERDPRYHFSQGKDQQAKRNYPQALYHFKKACDIVRAFNYEVKEYTSHLQVITQLIAQQSQRASNVSSTRNWTSLTVFSTSTSSRARSAAVSSTFREGSDENPSVQSNCCQCS